MFWPGPERSISAQLPLDLVVSVHEIGISNRSRHRSARLPVFQLGARAGT